MTTYKKLDIEALIGTLSLADKVKLLAGKVRSTSPQVRLHAC